jgi:hypothetical protein
MPDIRAAIRKPGLGETVVPQLVRDGEARELVVKQVTPSTVT